jgi:hypothetical protein
MDNVLKLARLIENAPGPVIAMAAIEEDEDSLAFSPRLSEELRMKAHTMMAHWPEYNKLYPPVPEVKGNFPNMGEILDDEIFGPPGDDMFGTENDDMFDPEYD